MADMVLSAAQKALRTNLNPNIYGSFAEIGAGQETVRHFFRAGGASGTIAKAMSAYDKEFSDAIYGQEDAGRYVTENRLRKMLNHEYQLLQERINRATSPDKCFFAFANTVATINFAKTFKGHGWLGVRYQTQADREANEVIVHVRLHEDNPKYQQETIGAMGVNLIYAAYNLYQEPKSFLLSLYDGIDRTAIEVDLINFSGPDFDHIDNRLMSLQLIKNGFTDAVIFGPEGKNLLPAELLYKKNVLAMRGSFRPVTKVNMDMIKKGYKQFIKSKNVQKDDAVVLFEITLNNLLADGALDEQDFLDRADILCSIGQTVLISNYQEYYRLVDYFAGFTKKRIGLIMGIPSLQEIFDEKYYEHLTGGILEAMGRLFSKSMVIYAYPFRGEASITTVSDIVVNDLFRNIFDYLKQTRRIRDIEDFDPEILSIWSREVLRKIRTGETGWEESLPTYVDNIIKEKGLFGYPKA
ncbi:MAG: TonB-dependent receptor [Flavobacteriaceae bacterium]|nr:TonB-dependent receptor [Flavobacteriaceae bacterium]PHX84029.1 MAG: nicotinate-nucleotide adenylyltransferase [Flavobacteriales bacterium]